MCDRKKRAGQRSLSTIPIEENQTPMESLGKPSREPTKKQSREDSPPPVNPPKFSRHQSQGDNDDVPNLLLRILEEFHKLCAHLYEHRAKDEKRQRAVSSSLQQKKLDRSPPLSSIIRVKRVVRS